MYNYTNCIYSLLKYNLCRKRNKREFDIKPQYLLKRKTLNVALQEFACHDKLFANLCNSIN